MRGPGAQRMLCTESKRRPSTPYSSIQTLQAFRASEPGVLHFVKSTLGRHGTRVSRLRCQTFHLQIANRLACCQDLPSKPISLQSCSADPPNLRNLQISPSSKIWRKPDRLSGWAWQTKRLLQVVLHLRLVEGKAFPPRPGMRPRRVGLGRSVQNGAGDPNSSARS